MNALFHMCFFRKCSLVLALMTALLTYSPASAEERKMLRAAPDVVFIEDARLAITDFTEWSESSTGFRTRHLTLRAVDLVTGKIRWSTDKTPYLAGLMMEGERITALVAVDFRGNNFAILDPATGSVRGSCEVARSDRADDGGYSSATSTLSGELLIHRRPPGHEQIPGMVERVRQVILIATASTCTLSLFAWGDEKPSSPPTPQAGVLLEYGQDEKRGWVDVRVGKLHRRLFNRRYP